ncbi:NUDIX hydrolase [Curtobacterium sp. BH-2-1-1]|uniref:NUDIX hydrolase n=1 Tax=Curtobacterium sp. BH-2-1-1 TaxID=1905847 RepID=UPI001C92C1DB|nr:NUDIX hydrolase [Curtobacterium sp. BH-2-1-1]
MTRAVLHENPYFRVVHHEVGEQSWYRVEAPDAAMIVGTTAEGELLMIRGSRGGADALQGYEFPGGLVDPGEDPATTAAREIEEETGYRATDLRPLGRFHTIAAVSSSECHVFEATVTRAGTPKLEPGEDWTTELVDRGRFDVLLRTSQIRDASTLAAAALYAARRS